MADGDRGRRDDDRPVERRRARAGGPRSQPRQAPRQQRAQDGEPGARAAAAAAGRSETPSRSSGYVNERGSSPAPPPRTRPGAGSENELTKLRVEQVVAAERRDRCRPRAPGSLDVELDGEAEPRGREGERVVERRRCPAAARGRARARARRPGARSTSSSTASTPSAAAASTAARLFSIERGRAAVPDPDDVPLAAQQLQHEASIAWRGGSLGTAVAQPVPREPAPVDDEVPLDPSAIEFRYRYHRALRHARVLRRHKSLALAAYRFYIALTVLLALAIAFVVGSWHEIQRLFGL